MVDIRVRNEHFHLKFVDDMALLGQLKTTRVFYDLVGILWYPLFLLVSGDVLRTFVHVVTHPTQPTANLLLHLLKGVDVGGDEIVRTRLERRFASTPLSFGCNIGRVSALPVHVCVHSQRSQSLTTSFLLSFPSVFDLVILVLGKAHVAEFEALALKMVTAIVAFPSSPTWKFFCFSLLYAKTFTQFYVGPFL